MFKIIAESHGKLKCGLFNSLHSLHLNMTMA